MITRAHGDDIDITVRIRRANLPTLLDGVALGIDMITCAPIMLSLVPVEEGVYSLAIEASATVKLATPDPVDIEDARGQEG